MTDPIAEPLAPDVIADLLAASATTVVAEIEALGGESGWRPAQGEWSANECVGHLIEAERRGFAGRIRQILAAAPDAPARLEAWDPPAVAEARHDDVRAGTELVAEFAALRADSVTLVRGLDRGRPDPLRSSPGGRPAPRRRASRRMGPPRPKSCPAIAGRHAKPGVGSDGQRPAIQRGEPMTRPAWAEA